MLISRAELEEKLIETLEQLNSNKKAITETQQNMLSFSYPEGKVVKLFRHPETIEDEDTRVLCLLSNMLQKYDKSLDVHSIFTPEELKEARQYSYEIEIADEDPMLPLDIEDVFQIGSSTWMGKLSIKQINELLKNEVLYYDFDTQREATRVKRGDNIISVPTLNKTSVKEIAKLIKDGLLEYTTLTFNGTIGSSDSGEEFIYNHKRRTLTINSGTKLAIIDGYHRVKGIQMALTQNPDIDFSLPVMFTNYPKSKARRYIGQIAKANPISKARQKELSKEKFSDEVVSILKAESELRGKISEKTRIAKSANELTSYDLLSDTIDQEFKLEKKIDAVRLGEYLSEFFNLLFGIYSDEFIDNINETRVHSYINHKYMFVGFLTLAKRLYENKTKLSINTIENMINKIDFSKDNPIWEEIGLKEVKNSNKVCRNIKEYFNTLEIE